LRLVSDNFLADLDHEARREAMRAAFAAPGGFKPPAPAKPRRQRKPTLASLIAKAKQLGVDMTVEPSGAGTFRTGSAAVDASNPEIELKKWVAKHAR
jgi:hypothetical protein